MRFTSALDDHSKHYTEELTFSNDEIVLLKRFRDDVRALAKRRVFNELAPARYNISYNEEQGLSFTAPQIDEEAWDAMMLRLRPLTVEQLSSHRFDLVRNMIARQFGTDAAKAHFKTIKDGYQGKLAPMTFNRGTANIAGEPPKLEPNGVFENGQGPVALFDKWMNAFDFHNDSDKRAYLEDMFRTMPREFVQGIVYLHIREMMTAMLHLANAIDGILNSKASD